MPQKITFCTLVLLIVFSKISISQESLNETILRYRDNLCIRKTDGTGYSKGITMDISVPCVWHTLNRPVVNDMVLSFEDSPNGGLSVSFFLTIRDLKKKNIAEEDKLYLLSEKFARSLLGNNSKLLSFKKTKISNLTASELIYESNIETVATPAKQFTINYMLPFQGNLILLTYVLSSTTLKDIPSIYEQGFTNLFRALAGTAIVQNAFK